MPYFVVQPDALGTQAGAALSPYTGQKHCHPQPGTRPARTHRKQSLGSGLVSFLRAKSTPVREDPAEVST
jgi:hypothetical protein